MRIAADPVEVPAERLASYAGSYGPRRLRVEGPELVYQREGREPYRLLPLSEDTFALEGMVDFRIRVVAGDDGGPVELMGLYVNGDSDSSPRDP
ncbi:MAG: hypothetical protein R3190_19120 [Thermoanaerobaculia bacterium]|nr:hypothetical protein [Thermoanaerobaculia bacterium]